MLVLTRKVGELIVIGDNLVRIQVLSLNNYQVRLGIEADRKLGVHRLEIYERIKSQEREKT